MLFKSDSHPGSLAHAMRLQSTLSVMDDSVRAYIYEQLREAEIELHIQQAATRQLEADLQAEIHRDHRNGTESSLLYQKLPPEIRAHIYSYVVSTPKSVHVFPPKGNESHGYRLSLCDESSYDFDLGHCRCDDSRTRGTVTSNFFDNALFLVSRSVRREALDAFFLVNRFTFTCLNELVRFTSSFKTSCSKIQQIRILERVDDYPDAEFRVRGIQKARQRLKALKHLELYVFLSTFSIYETWHEDGLVNQLMHFALGPPPVATLPSDTHKMQKRKLSEVDDGGSVEDGSAKKTTKTDDSTPLSKEIPDKPESSVNEDDKVPSLTSSPTISETSLSSLSDSARNERLVRIANAYAGEESLPNTTLDSSPTPSTTTKPLNHPSAAPCPTVPTIDRTTPFPVPPLKSFKATVRLRNLQLSLRSRPDTAKAEYYASLYTRLTEHLTDVFLDGGRKYRVVEDIPSLGEKPKLRVRDDEKVLVGAEKRGILYLKD